MAKNMPRKRGKTDDETPPASLEAVRISVIVTKDQRQQLKVVAAARGVTISEVIRQGIASFLGGASR